MIWHRSRVAPKHLPPNSSAALIGKYNEPGQTHLPLVQILLEINGPDGVETHELYSHNPSAFIYEEPNPDDIYARYAAKISKFRGNLDYKKIIRRCI